MIIAHTYWANISNYYYVDTFDSIYDPDYFDFIKSRMRSLGYFGDEPVCEKVEFYFKNEKDELKLFDTFEKRMKVSS